jgi:hypothetical protein
MRAALIVATDGNLFAVEHERAYPDVFTSDRPFYINDGELGGRQG